MSYKDSEFKQKQTKSQLSICSNEIKTKISIDESFNISSTIIKILVLQLKLFINHKLYKMSLFPEYLELQRSQSWASDQKSDSHIPRGSMNKLVMDYLITGTFDYNNLN